MRKAAVLSILVLLAVAVMAEAQQPVKVPRIGIVTVNRYPQAQPVMRPSVKDCAGIIEWKVARNIGNGDLIDEIHI